MKPVMNYLTWFVLSGLVTWVADVWVNEGELDWWRFTLMMVAGWLWGLCLQRAARRIGPAHGLKVGQMVQMMGKNYVVVAVPAADVVRLREL